jgi:SAM-dependent methyltransferase
VGFDVTADAYDRFMGRFSEPLAELFVEWVDVRPGQRALDVGCGPGALTARLVERVGVGSVAALDPSDSFVAAARSRFPDLDVRRAAAEQLPYPDDTFDAALAQLVVHFMKDPVAGLREMARVTRPGGVVAACVWDHAGGTGPLSTFWQAARDLDPHSPGEADLPGTKKGQLVDLAEAAGLRNVEPGALTVTLRFASFADWWEPFTLGVGPAGDYVAGLDESARAELAAACVRSLAPAPFETTASAWCIRARP